MIYLNSDCESTSSSKLSLKADSTSSDWEECGDKVQDLFILNLGIDIVLPYGS